MGLFTAIANGRSFVVVIALGLASVISGASSSFAADAPPPETHVVVIESMKFTPSTLEIRAGDQVTFKNSDLVPHTATAKPKELVRFDSGPLKPGDSWTVRPQGKQAIHYGCTFHPTMDGVILIKD